MSISVINTSNIRDISSLLLMNNGKVKLLSYKEYEQFSRSDLRAFCHFKARYGIPTIELVDYLKNIINGRTAIEIGAGSGDLGFHLGIPMTDSKLQEEPYVKSILKLTGQPAIGYPQDVEKIESLEAVKKYKPQVVIGSWVTTYSPYETTYGSNPQGIKEPEILDLVETYIVIGNLDVHGDKPIRKLQHQEISEKFIISRAKNPENNRIFIWNRK